MDQNLVTIEIDGKPVTAKLGSMLIEVTDAEGITVPRFCYHKKLSIAANCRMCLVDVERAPKPLPACATPIVDGMKVWTRSVQAVNAQRDTMEFLLINHPLDCPICDQGGECELQDLSVKHGSSSSQFDEIKRVVIDKDIGSLISTEMTRCIQCTRCVRFGEEISGMREMGALGRGDRMEIGTFVEKSLVSELSGNIIDICPVGALTAKPSRYKARAWEVRQHKTIANHDSLGSNIYVHTFKNEVIRVVPRENDELNECWISNRDRFSYEGLAHKDRLTKPQIKVNGEWKAVSWDDALTKAASFLKSTDGDDIGVWVSPNSTVEEMHLIRRLADHLETPHIDSRLRQSDFSEHKDNTILPILGISLSELEQQDIIVLVGSDVRHDQPLLNHRIRKAVLAGAKVFAINPYQLDFNYPVEQFVTGVSGMLDQLFSLAKATGTVANNVSDPLSKHSSDTTDFKQLANLLTKADNTLILLGNMAVSHPNYSHIHALSAVIQKNTQSMLGYLPEASNTVGAWKTGCISSHPKVKQGDDFHHMLVHAKKTLMIFAVEPEHDCNQAQMALAAAYSAESVVVFAHYDTKHIRQYADVILPISHSYETSGSFINMLGEIQSFKGVSPAPDEARPAWKVLRVLGNQLGVDHFDYMDSQQILSDFLATAEANKPFDSSYTINKFKYVSDDLRIRSGFLRRIGPHHSLAIDSLVRHASALQESVANKIDTVFLNQKDYDSLGLEEKEQVKVFQEDETVIMKVAVNNAVPEKHILIYAGSQYSARLGDAFGYVQVQEV